MANLHGPHGLPGEYPEEYRLLPSEYPTAEHQLENAGKLARLPVRFGRVTREDFLAALGAPVVMKAFGPTAEDREFHLEPAREGATWETVESL